MSTFYPLNPLPSAVIEILAEEPGITTAELLVKIRKRGVDCSSPTLYRLVSQLIDAQMLVRERKQLFLSTVWVSHLHQLCETTTQQYFTNVRDSFGLPLRPGERREFFGHSLAALDPIWNHLMMRIASCSRADEWYEYDAHNWYALGAPDTEHRFYQSLVAQGIRCFLVQGGSTYLDRQRYVQCDGMKTVLVTETPFPKEGYILIVCGDYITECIFPEVLNEQFSSFYDTVQSMTDFQPDMFANVFQMKARVKIVVRRSQKEVASLKQKIEQCFTESM